MESLSFVSKSAVLARSKQGTNRAVIPVKKTMIQASNLGSEALLNLTNLLNGNESDLMPEGSPLGNP